MSRPAWTADRIGELIFAGIVFALGMYALLGAFAIRTPAGAQVGPRVFPFMVGTSTEASRKHAMERWHLPHYMQDLDIEFQNHFEAAREVIDFFAGDGIQLKGATVADIGCGDGAMAYGVAHLGEPASMVGYDIVPVDSGRITSSRCGFALPPPS